MNYNYYYEYIMYSRLKEEKEKVSFLECIM